MAVAAADLFVLSVVALVLTPIAAFFVIEGYSATTLPWGALGARLFLLILLPLVAGP